MTALTSPIDDDVAQALWYVAPGQAEIREEKLSPPGPGEVRVRAQCGALSLGTERLVLTGRVPAVNSIACEHLSWAAISRSP